MTATATPQPCSACGMPLPPDAPQGECPRCLLKAGYESQPVHATRSYSPHSSFVPPSVAELQGRFPQYEILELIGQGGMGAVYKAKQAGLGRLVAIKILPLEISQAAFTERFSREARALALLSHPRIVAVHDFGQADGLCYFVMEFVDGVNLRQAIQAGKMNPAEALAIIPQICEALQFAHDEGVVHRDIKPENILIDKRGRVKIADFGLAKLLRLEPADQALTGTQQVMGTLRYMAPEQMLGSREVDHRADIFSLGVVFYELLTGELPIGRFAVPSKKASIDSRLDAVVLRALESEPELRYQHASEVKDDVDSITSNANITPVPDRPLTAKIKLPQVIQWPADALQLMAGASFLMGLLPLFFFALGRDIKSTALEASGVLFAYAAVIGAAGWAMKSLQSRGLVLAGVFTMGLVLPVVLGINAVSDVAAPWPAWISIWLGMPVALWAIVILFRPDVQTAFELRATSGQQAWQQTFAGSTAHIVVCLLLSVGTLWFVLFVGNPVLTMIDGPDTQLLELGRRWHIGSNVNSIFSTLVALFCLQLTATGFAWWTYRTALKSRRPAQPDSTPSGSNLALQSKLPISAIGDAQPRLSQAALGGVILAPLFLLTVLMLSASVVPVHVERSGDGPPAGRGFIHYLILVPLALIGLAGACSPFATTLLGVISIGQIRRSAGKIYGMPLAVFDALLYPLLLLDVVLLSLGWFGLLFGLRSLIRVQPGEAEVGLMGPSMLVVLLLIPLILLLDLFLIRMTWRAANDNLPAPTAGPKPPPFPPRQGGHQQATSVLVIVLVVLAVFTIPALLVGGLATAYFFSSGAPAPQAPGITNERMPVEDLTNPAIEVEGKSN